MICQSVALKYKPCPQMPGGTELDKMIPCRNEATTTRWISRGTVRQKLQHYCIPCAARSDAFIQKLRDGLERTYAERGEEPIVYHQGVRVRVVTNDAWNGRVGTVVGLPSRHWGNEYSVHLDGKPFGKPDEFHSTELTFHVGEMMDA
ncbi:hypothetical protein [Kitasatospora sp. NPDC050543]|uniref:hypothetical protein n=1 Tax=Kitasatospora sp. NPDC050543 TaxID=3364054 RepID=UPI0037B5E555